MYSDYDIRMKSYYEKRHNYSLTRRTPVIIRVDGKSFHNFCRRFKKPYDELLNDSLNNVMKFLCENIQGAKIAERHSDEISILLTDFDTINTDAFFDYEIQKIDSVVSSMVTAEFCKNLLKSKQDAILNNDETWPNFDCRCFTIPKDEISNYFWWRMLDAKRNSINMLARSNFSHKQLHKKTCNEMQEMLWQEKKINWNNIPQGQKSGFMCFKSKVEKEIPVGPMKGQKVMRNVWIIRTSPSTKNELDDIINGIEFVKNRKKTV